MTSLFVATESTGAVPAFNTVNQPFGNAVCQSGEEVGVRPFRLSREA